MAERIDKQIHADELKLRILMTDGCNKDCLFCLNDFQPKPQNGKVQFLSPNRGKIAITQYVSSFKGKYPLQVYFSGGEPTLHPDLTDLMSYAKSLNCRVTLITNGDFPHSLESELISSSDKIHFGTYRKSEKQAERVDRMGGLIQSIYPKADASFIEFYSKYDLPIKIFRDFYDNSDSYVTFVDEITKKFPEANLSFRHTGIQENRGIGCGGCEKKCVTLKAAWVFPDGGTSPCPQLYKQSKIYPKNSKDWLEYFNFVENYHKISTKKSEACEGI